jgi:hypothetical protein
LRLFKATPRIQKGPYLHHTAAPFPADDVRDKGAGLTAEALSSDSRLARFWLTGVPSMSPPRRFLMISASALSLDCNAQAMHAQASKQGAEKA